MTPHPTAEQLSALIDGELSLVAREAVGAHLRECPTCAAQQQDLVEVAAAFAALPAERWTIEMTAAVLERAPAQAREPDAPLRTQDWSLPIAAALAVLGFAAVALAAPFPVTAMVDGVRLNVFAAFAEGAGVPFGGFLAVLFLLPVLGLFAVPLLRRR